MSGFDRCGKCASDQIIHGAYLESTRESRIVVGTRLHPDHGPLERSVSTRVYACVCGSCGFVELYANQPRELYDVYQKASHRRTHAEVTGRPNPESAE